MLSILFLIIHFQHDVDQQTDTLKETKLKKATIYQHLSCLAETNYNN